MISEEDVSGSLGSSKKTAVVFLSAGEGKRFDIRVDKLSVRIGGDTILSVGLRTIIGMSFISELVIVTRGEVLKEVEEQLERVITSEGRGKIRTSVVTGGNSRAESASIGVAKAESEVVLIHDASRPLTSSELFRRVALEVESGVGVVPAIVPTDSIVLIEGKMRAKSYEDRSLLRMVQTPQGFIREEYRKAVGIVGRRLPSFTDDGSMFLSAGYAVKIIEGERSNIKLTFPEDLLVAEFFLSSAGRAK